VWIVTIGLLSSAIIIIRSNNWLLLFLRLELNIIIFIILLWKSNGEGRIKYFIINSFSSLLLVYSVIISINIMRITVLLFKLALPPFLSWGVDIINWMRSVELSLFLTIQKIGLIILLTNFNLIWGIGMLVAGSVLAVINNSSIISILFISSLVHSVWLIVRRFQSFTLLILYFIIYSTMLLVAVRLTADNIKIIIKSELAIVILVLRGLPPFLLFYFKWLILSNLMSLSILLSLLFLLCSLVIIIVYFRVFYINIILGPLPLPVNTTKHLVLIFLLTVMFLL